MGIFHISARPLAPSAFKASKHFPTKTLIFLNLCSYIQIVGYILNCTNHFHIAKYNHSLRTIINEEYVCSENRPNNPDFLMMQHILFFYVTFAIISTTVFGFQFRNTQQLNRKLFKIHSTSQGSALNKSPLELCDENALIVIEEVKAELGTIFGYDQGSKNVGISGEIELVEVDGPSIRIKLSGRFWHATDTVLMRVESFVKTRIPEVIEVILDEEASEILDDNRLNSEGGPRKLY